MFKRGHMYEENEEQTKKHYTLFLDELFDGTPHYASVCEECGECKAKCPQNVPFREHLKTVREYFWK
jgi:predicted aldo/keto reductase-like oxidoreductase